MARKVNYRCNNCGERFEIDVLDPGEIEQAQRRRETIRPIRCPRCGRTDLREGWD